LTGIPNRLSYQQRIAIEYKRWKRFGRPLSLAVWDIDYFKRVNDSHGHAAGDQVLQVVGKTLARSMRETDFVARFGGEEFVVLLVDAGAEMALMVAEKLRTAVEALRLNVAGQTLLITVSCGVAEFRADEEPEAVFERADRALYAAKQAGRNRCERAV
jgi:diguanylate cyclase